mmetsp:Transcript_30515/g.85462  ORF Transcript_30515/g.85462 Transcript_30515/m.85462 type:complete len:255 (-) Transcript_30515:57-821(-)
MAGTPGDLSPVARPLPRSSQEMGAEDRQAAFVHHSMKASEASSMTLLPGVRRPERSTSSSSPSFTSTGLDSPAEPFPDAAGDVSFAPLPWSRAMAETLGSRVMTIGEESTSVRNPLKSNSGMRTPMGMAPPLALTAPSAARSSLITGPAEKPRMRTDSTTRRKTEMPSIALPMVLHRVSRTPRLQRRRTGEGSWNGSAPSPMVRSFVGSASQVAWRRRSRLASLARRGSHSPARGFSGVLGGVRDESTAAAPAP